MLLAPALWPQTIWLAFRELIGGVSIQFEGFSPHAIKTSQQQEQGPAATVLPEGVPAKSPAK